MPRRVGGPQVAALQILLTLREKLGIPRAAFPILAFLPLPPGLLREPLARLTENGLPVPSHNRALSHWPDGSIRWLGIEAAANCRPRQEKRLLAWIGEPAMLPFHSPLTCQPGGSTTTLVSGPLWIQWNLESALPTLEVRHDLNEDGAFEAMERRLGPFGLDRLWLEAPDGSVHRPMAPRDDNGIRILRASPYSALVETRGRFHCDGQVSPYQYAIGMEAWAAKPFLRLFVQVEIVGRSARWRMGRHTLAPGGAQVPALHRRDEKPKIPRAVHLDLPTAFSLQGVRMEDPSGSGEVLDILLDPGETLRIRFETGYSEIGVAGPEPRRLAGGAGGGRWFDTGDLFTGFSMAALDSRGALEASIERRQLSLSLRPRPDGQRRWWWEVVLGFHKFDRVEDIVAFGRALLDLPMLALPDWESVLSSSVAPPDWPAVEAHPDLFRELEEEIARQEDDAPGCDLAALSSLVALHRGLPETWRKAGRRVRRQDRLSISDGDQDRWEAEGAAILAAAAPQPDPLAARSDPTCAADLGVLLEAFRLDPRSASGGEEILERFHRVRALSGWPELKLAFLPLIYRLAEERGYDLERLPVSLFRLTPSEEPFLIRPGETRSIVLVVEGNWDLPQQADLFPIVEEPFALNPLARSAEIGPAPSAVSFALSHAGSPDSARERNATLEVGFPGTSAYAPGAVFRLASATERIGWIGDLPALLRDRMARSGLGLARIDVPWAAALEDLDLLIVGSGARDAMGPCARAIGAGVPCLLVDVAPGAWVSAGPLMLSIGENACRVEAVAKGGEVGPLPSGCSRPPDALASSGVLEGVLGSPVPHPAIALGSHWRALATSSGGRVACAEAEGRGWVGLAQCRPIGASAHRFYAALLDRALDAAGL